MAKLILNLGHPQSDALKEQIVTAWGAEKWIDCLVAVKDFSIPFEEQIPPMVTEFLNHGDVVAVLPCGLSTAAIVAVMAIAGATGQMPALVEIVKSNDGTFALNNITSLAAVRNEAAKKWRGLNG